MGRGGASQLVVLAVPAGLFCVLSVASRQGKSQDFNRAQIINTAVRCSVARLVTVRAEKDLIAVLAVINLFNLFLVYVQYSTREYSEY